MSRQGEAEEFARAMASVGPAVMNLKTAMSGVSGVLSEARRSINNYLTVMQLAQAKGGGVKGDSRRSSRVETASESRSERQAKRRKRAKGRSALAARIENRTKN